MLSLSVTTPVDLIHEAGEVLARTPQTDFDAVRSNYIAEALSRFGDDIAEEVANTLPIGTLFVQ